VSHKPKSKSEIQNQNPQNKSNQIKQGIHISLQEGRSSTFSWLQKIENAGRLNKEIENMKIREKLGSAGQRSRSDDHQIYCSTKELDAEVILRKLSRMWRKSFFDEITMKALG